MASFGQQLLFCILLSMATSCDVSVNAGFGFVEISSGLDEDTEFGGSGQSLGPIEFVDSDELMLNQRNVESASASFVFDDIAGTQDDLQIGQVINATVDFEAPPSANASASSISFRSNLIGPISTIALNSDVPGSATITLLGQTVLLNSGTNLVSVKVEDLVVGDLVRISGLTDAGDNLIATFVEPLASVDSFQVFGTVDSVNVTTLSINGLTIAFSDASQVNLPTGLGIGQLVNVTIDDLTPSITGVFDATIIEGITSVDLALNQSLEIEGIITELSSTSSFQVADVSVMTNTDTEFLMGAADDLALNARIEVEGVVDADTNLLAERIRLIQTGPTVALGPVTAIDTNAQSLSLLGLTFELSPATELVEASSGNSLTLPEVNVGDQVQILGDQRSSELSARRVERITTAPTTTNALLIGAVTSIDTASPSLSVLGVSIGPNTSDTEFSDSVTQSIITQGEFFTNLSVGASVRVEWDDFVSTDIAPDRIVLIDN